MLKSSETSHTEKDKVKKDNFPCSQAVGALMYLMLDIRLNLVYGVRFLSRSLKNPSTDDQAPAKRVCRYTAETIDLGILYNNNAETGNLDKARVIVKYIGGAITWLSHRQALVVSLTTESENVACNGFLFSHGN